MRCGAAKFDIWASISHTSLCVRAARRWIFPWRKVKEQNSADAKSPLVVNKKKPPSCIYFYILSHCCRGQKVMQRALLPAAACTAYKILLYRWKNLWLGFSLRQQHVVVVILIMERVNNFSERRLCRMRRHKSICATDVENVHLIVKMMRKCGEKTRASQTKAHQVLKCCKEFVLPCQGFIIITRYKHGLFKISLATLFGVRL